MFCYRGIMHKINKIPKRSLRLLLKNCKDDFQDLLRSPGDISIHQRCINSLLTELCKYINVLSPEIMNEIFSNRSNICNTRQFNIFETQIPTSNRYGFDSILYKAKLSNLLSENLKSYPSVTLFKNETKLWECFSCLCNICKNYARNLGYVFHTVSFSPAFSPIPDTGLSVSFINYRANANTCVNI